MEYILELGGRALFLYFVIAFGSVFLKQIEATKGTKVERNWHLGLLVYLVFLAQGWINF